MDEDYNFFFWLSVVANILQIENYRMLLKDATNNDILKELQIQDQTLAEQTNVYLKKIIEQNEEILKEIKKRKEQIDYSFLK